MISYEDVFSLMAARRSIRRFKSDPVPEELLIQIVRAAGRAPSASNRQDWHFTAIQSQIRREGMAEMVKKKWDELLNTAGDSGTAEALQSYASNFDWFARAPVVLAVSCRETESFLHHILGDQAAAVSGSHISAGMAVQNLLLACTASGLGACCLTGPLAAADELKAQLGIGRRRRLVCLLAVGYPDENPAESGHKEVEDILELIK